MSKLQDALRRKYASPEAAIRALGLSPDLISGPRMACDEMAVFVEKWANYGRNWKPAKAKIATDARDEGLATTYATRWPDAAKIRTW